MLCHGPGQQLIDPVDVMVCNALEHIAQIGLRIDAAQLGSANQRINHRRRVSSAIRAKVQIVFPANGNAPENVFTIFPFEVKMSQ